MPYFRKYTIATDTEAMEPAINDIEHSQRKLTYDEWKNMTYNKMHYKERVELEEIYDKYFFVYHNNLKLLP